jgi:acetoin utilization protein AcuB
MSVNQPIKSQVSAPTSATQRLSPTIPTQVSDVMTHDITTMQPEQSFAEVVGLMATHSFRHLLVVDSDEHLHGVVSDRDVLRALSRTPDWSKKSVSEIMTRDSITITPECAITTAVRLMLEKRINCLPVIGPDGRVSGILTSTDLLIAYEKVQQQIEQTAL